MEAGIIGFILSSSSSSNSSSNSKKDKDKENYDEKELSKESTRDYIRKNERIHYIDD